jgi:cytochrome c oxidase cbb3-type subunit III
MTRNGPTAFWLLLPLTAALSAGCDAPGRPKLADKPITPDQVHSFTALFAMNCSGCHGADGTLGPAPPLNDPLFRSIVTEQDLEAVIRSGRPNKPMPAFARKNGGALTATQIQIIVKEIKGIPYKIVTKFEDDVRKVEVVASADGTQPKWGAPATASGAPAYALAAATGDRDKGARVFTQACAGCHGDHGKGQGNHGALRINDPAFLALVSDQTVRRYAITGRPDLGMPSYKGKDGRPDDFHPLTSDEITDLVALFAFWRQGGSAQEP